MQQIIITNKLHIERKLRFKGGFYDLQKKKTYTCIRTAIIDLTHIQSHSLKLETHTHTLRTQQIYFQIEFLVKIPTKGKIGKYTRILCQLVYADMVQHISENKNRSKFQIWELFMYMFIHSYVKVSFCNFVNVFVLLFYVKMYFVICFYYYLYD